MNRFFLKVVTVLIVGITLVNARASSEYSNQEFFLAYILSSHADRADLIRSNSFCYENIGHVDKQDSNNNRLNGVPPPCRFQDSLVLVNLYNILDGINWTYTATSYFNGIGQIPVPNFGNAWNFASPIDTWHGVVLNAQGCVDRLILNDCNLSGVLTNVALSELRWLVLNDNNLTGDIPTGLGNLTGLEYLDLSFNQLSGNLPSELGSLNDLQTLRLSVNQLSGSIPSELGSLTNLRSLSCFNNELSGSIPIELGNLNNLTGLYISDNELSGNIPSELGSLNNLQYLWLSSNELSGSIPIELGNLNNLQTLRLSSNELSGSIPSELGSLNNLRSLSLFNNQLSGNIPSELGSLTNLQTLDIFDNELSGSIPIELGNLNNLQTLRLSGNELSGSIPSELGNLNNLQSFLDLASNQLSGNIPSELGGLNNLRYLWLYNNELSGNIPSELGGLNNLQELRLNDNQLESCFPNELNIFCSLGFNTNVLSDGYNFTNNPALPWSGDFERFCNGETQIGAFCNDDDAGTSGEEILDDCMTCAVAACTHPDYDALMALYNSTNGPNWTNNTGWVDGAAGTDCDPCSWYGVTCDGNGRVTCITLTGDEICEGWITAPGNNLSGTLPSEIGDLAFLENLNLKTNNGTNQIGGTIPTTIGNLTNLISLDLSGNDFIGSIPITISSLVNIESLSLGGNQLSGNIPSQIWDLTSLTYLSLSQNNFTGSISSDIGNLINLTGLDLQRNLLAGSIPAEIGLLSNLTGLWLWGNDLTGSVPGELGDLSNLVQLWLQGNDFSGCYDSNLLNLCNISTVNFSNSSQLPWQGDFSQFCATDGSQAAQIGAPCDDGNALTTNDAIDDDCNCSQLLVCPPSFVVSLTTSDNNTCPGDQVDLIIEFNAGSPPYSFDYRINGGSIMTFTNASSFTSLPFFPTEDTDYEIVSITDNDGCVDDAGYLVTVIVESLPLINPIVTNDVCINGIDNFVDLTQYDNSLSPGNNILWWENSLGTIAISDPTFYFFNDPSIITLYAQAEDPVTGCRSDIQAVDFDVNDLPVITIVDIIGNFCAGEELEYILEITDGEPPYAGGVAYDGQVFATFSNEFNTTVSLFVTFPTAGNYGYTITPLFVSDVNECPPGVGPLPFFEQVVAPSPTVNAIPPLTACTNGGGDATFDLTIANDDINNDGGIFIEWYADETLTNSIFSPSNYVTSSDETVHAVAENSEGCLSEPLAVDLITGFLDDPVAGEDQAVSTIGGSDGIAFVIIEEGIPPFELVYTTAGFSDNLPANNLGTTNIEDLIAGMYDLIVTDINGCEAQTTFTITEPDCTVDGGTLTGGPFTFCVGDGEADMIPAGAITLTGDNGTNTTWVITDNNDIILALPPDYTDTDFDGAGTGACLVRYISYEDGLPGLAVGEDIADLDGCFDFSNPITVNRVTNGPACDPDCDLTATINASTTNLACAGDTNAQLDLITNGSFTITTIEWSNPAWNGTTIDNVGAGTHSVTVTDAENCMAIASVTINEPSGISFGCAGNPVTDAGPGSASVTIFGGGTPPFTVSWTGSSTGSMDDLNYELFFIANPTVASNYTVTIEDVNGCSDTCEIPVADISTPECEHPDYPALIALYNTTNGSNWTNNTGWAAGAAETDCEPCNWFGITCDVNNRVLTIDLTDNNLDGTLPDAISGLTELRVLHLDNNNFEGTLTNEIGNLSNLIVLQINLMEANSTGFSGPLPASLGNLSNLTRLDLGWHRFTEELPASIGQLSNLEELNLELNDFSGSIPPEWGGLGSIRELRLFETGLSGTLPSEIQSWTQLETFDASFNGLNGNLPDEIQFWTNITDLRLNHNNFTGAIPSEFQFLNNLETLYLNDNNFNDCYFESIENLCEVADLDFSENPLLPWEGDFSRYCMGETQVGASCDDGNPDTIVDEIQEDCSCGDALTFNPTPDAFITVWQTDNPGDSEDNQITIPGTGTNYLIEWEDVNDPNSFGSLTGNNITTVTFPVAGTYRVYISGDFTRIQFGLGNNVVVFGDPEKLIDIAQWGNIQWSTMEDAFNKCINMNSSAIDVPVLTSASSLRYMFGYCEQFDAPIGGWDVSAVTNMSYMFYAAESFNQPLENWNTSAVTDMSGIFSQADAFNQPIGNWNTSAVTDMRNMFYAARAFNQPIGDWNTTAVTSMFQMFTFAFAFNQPLGNWNTSDVMNMQSMFRAANAFNQPIGNWNTSSVTSMRSMFSGADAFNQCLELWGLNNIAGEGCGSLADDLCSMFSNSAISCENYNATLAGWAANDNTPDNLSLGAEALVYSDQSAHDILVNDKGWTITGDTFDPDCALAALNFTLPDLTINQGDSFCLPLTVDNFTNILGMQFSINYDADVLTYTGTQNFTTALLGWNTGSIGNPVPGNLTPTWNDPNATGADLPDGTVLVELCFSSTSANNSAITFSGSPTPIEVIDGNEENVAFTSSGSLVTVLEATVPVAISMPVVNTEIGESICIPLVVENFIDILGVQFGITYDPNFLSFEDAINLNGNLPGFNYNPEETDTDIFNPAPGDIRLAWNNLIIGSGVSLEDGATMVELCFTTQACGTGSVGISGSTIAIEFINSLGQDVGFVGTDAQITTFSTLDLAVANSTNPGCGQSNNGTIELEVINGLAPYNFQWSNGDTTARIENLLSGVYTATVTDSRNCSAISETIELVEVNDLILTCPPDQSLTIEANSTEILLLFPAPDAGPCSLDSLRYTLSGAIVQGETQGVLPITSFPVGTTTVEYYVPGQDTCSFAITITQAVDPCTLFAVTSNSVTAPLCLGGEDGSIEITVLNGTEPYTYNWSNGATTEDLDNLPAGLYTLTLTDANDCEISASFWLEDPEPYLVTANIINDTEDAGGSGSIQLMTNVVPPPSIEWFNAVNETVGISLFVNQLVTGTYTAIVTDSDGCAQSFSYQVDQLTEAATILPDCGSAASGSIDLSVNGVTGPHTYQWSNSEMTEDVSNLLAGSYTVTITDISTARLIRTYEVPANNLLLSCAATMAASGSNEADGTAAVTINGGELPYSVSFTTPAGPVTAFPVNEMGEFTFTNLPGDYTVNVTDAGGCEQTCEFTIEAITATEPVVLSLADLSAPANEQLCIPITVSGFTDIGSFQFALEYDTTALTFVELISHPNLNPSVTPTGEGLFLTWIDLGGGGSVSLPNESILAEACFMPIACGVFNLALPLMSNSGNAEFTNLSLVNLPLETNDGSLDITSDLTLGLLVENPTCNQSNGSITAQLTDGSGDYTYEWNVPGNTSILNNLGAGESYALTVTDELSGCTAIATTETLVNQGEALEMTMEASICQGGSYPFNGEQLTEEGTYMAVFSTDPSGCDSTITLILDVLPIPVADIMGDTTFCAGDGPQLLSVAPAASYQWSTGSTTQTTLIGSALTEVSVTITNAAGCTASDVVQILSGEAPEIIISGELNVCDGQSTLLTASGGITYEWSSGSTTAEAELLAGTHAVEVTNAAGCSNIELVTIMDSPSPILPNYENEQIGCGEGTLLTLELNTTPPLTVDWYADDNQLLAAGQTTYSPATAGTYLARVRNTETGCESIDVAIFNYSEVDIIPPVIMNCPDDFSVTLNTAMMSEVTVNWTEPTALDNCELESLTSTLLSGSSISASTAVTYTAIDLAGNETGCSFNINVVQTDELTIYVDSAEVVVTDNVARVPICVTSFTEVEGLSFSLRLLADTLDAEMLSFDSIHPGILNGLEITLEGDPDSLLRFFWSDTSGDPTNLSLPDSSTLFHLLIELTGDPGACAMLAFTDDPLDRIVSKLGVLEGIPSTLDGPVCRPAVGTLAGYVRRADGSRIKEVEVSCVGGEETLITYTDEAGYYEFADLLLGKPYTLTPRLDTLHRNGVNIIDRTLMSRHILQVQPLATPYQLIAADVTGDGSINIIDFVQLGYVILQIFDDFPTNTSWRFVDEEYNFPDPMNPWSESFPEFRQIETFSRDSLQNNFIGIKIGDLNDSATSFGGGGSLGDGMGLWEFDDTIMIEPELLTTYSLFAHQTTNNLLWLWQQQHKNAIVDKWRSWLHEKQAKAN